MLISAILRGKGGDVITAHPDSTVKQAADILTEKGIGAIVIATEDRRVLGILSERDIVRSISAQGADSLDKPVTDIMTKEVFTCASDQDMNHLRRAMTERRIRHIPIVDDDHLTGIVSIGDVVKSRLDELEHEAEEMRKYIANA